MPERLIFLIMVETDKMIVAIPVMLLVAVDFREWEVPAETLVAVLAVDLEALWVAAAEMEVDVYPTWEVCRIWEADRTWEICRVWIICRI